MNVYLLQTIATLLAEGFLFFVIATRYKNKIPAIFKPFAIICCVGFINDLLCTVLAYTIRNNTIPNNIYVLVEFIFLVVQFYKWNSISKTGMSILLGLGVTVWISEMFFISSITEFGGVFRTTYSFIVLFLAIWQINRLLIFERSRLIVNPIFLICISFIFYYTYKCVNELMYMVQVPFYNIVWNILSFSNIAVQIVYIIAFLCMPTRKKFTLQY